MVPACPESSAQFSKVDRLWVSGMSEPVRQRGGERLASGYSTRSLRGARARVLERSLMPQGSSLNPCRAAADAGRGWWRTTTGVAAPRRCGVSAGHELFSGTALAQQVAARGLPVQVHHAPTFDEVERRAGFAFFPALV